jgi:hypothetical protein
MIYVFDSHPRHTRGGSSVVERLLAKEKVAGPSPVPRSDKIGHLMSDNILKLIPTDPEYVPSQDKIESAKKLIASFFPKADEVSINIYDGIAFIDPGGNFEKVSCPQCNTDLIDWWSKEAMNITRKDPKQKYFDNLMITTPCCKTNLSINDLKYDWPAGFARFNMEIRNPNTTLSDNEVADFEKTIGTTIRKIMAHY